METINEYRSYVQVTERFRRAYLRFDRNADDSRSKQFLIAISRRRRLEMRLHELPGVFGMFHRLRSLLDAESLPVL